MKVKKFKEFIQHLPDDAEVVVVGFDSYGNIGPGGLEEGVHFEHSVEKLKFDAKANKLKIKAN